MVTPMGLYHKMVDSTYEFHIMKFVREEKITLGSIIETLDEQSVVSWNTKGDTSMEIDLKNCPHCFTKGILPMSGDICPNCKKPFETYKDNAPSSETDSQKRESTNIEQSHVRTSCSTNNEPRHEEGSSTLRYQVKKFGSFLLPDGFGFIGRRGLISIDTNAVVITGKTTLHPLIRIIIYIIVIFAVCIGLSLFIGDPSNASILDAAFVFLAMYLAIRLAATLMTSKMTISIERDTISDISRANNLIMFKGQNPKTHKKRLAVIRLAANDAISIGEELNPKLLGSTQRRPEDEQESVRTEQSKSIILSIAMVGGIVGCALGVILWGGGQGAVMGSAAGLFIGAGVGMTIQVIIGRGKGLGAGLYFVLFVFWFLVFIVGMTILTILSE